MKIIVIFFLIFSIPSWAEQKIVIKSTSWEANYKFLYKFNKASSIYDALYVEELSSQLKTPNQYASQMGIKADKTIIMLAKINSIIQIRGRGNQKKELRDYFIGEFSIDCNQDRVFPTRVESIRNIDDNQIHVFDTLTLNFVENSQLLIQGDDGRFLSNTFCPKKSR